MPSTWRERQKRELRQQIYDTALQLFEAQGYEASTVQQITDKVGIAKGTFFNHFPSKEHVVARWYDDITRHALDAAEHRPPMDAETAIGELFVDLTRRATASPELLIAKFRHNADPLLLQAERRQDEVVHGVLHRLLSDGKTRGELDEDLDEGFFARLLTTVLSGSSRAWVRTEPRFEFPTVIVEQLRFLFIAARSARR